MCERHIKNQEAAAKEVPDILEVRNHVEEELFGKTRLSCEHQTLQVVTMLTDELEDGRVGQRHRVTNVQGTKLGKLSSASQVQQNLKKERNYMYYRVMKNSVGKWSVRY